MQDFTGNRKKIELNDRHWAVFLDNDKKSLFVWNAGRERNFSPIEEF
jgi:hypothetical protein